MAISRRKEVAYTKCKTWGHWMDLVPLPTNADYVLRCERCGGVRHVFLDVNTGLVHSSYYELPKDYKDVGVKLTKAELRAAALKEQRRQIRQKRKLKAVA